MAVFHEPELAGLVRRRRGPHVGRLARPRDGGRRRPVERHVREPDPPRRRSAPRVSGFTDPHTALAAVRDWDPDLVVLDAPHARPRRHRLPPRVALGRRARRLPARPRPDRRRHHRLDAPGPRPPVRTTTRPRPSIPTNCCCGSGTSSACGSATRTSRRTTPSWRPRSAPTTASSPSTRPTTASSSSGSPINSAPAVRRCSSSRSSTSGCGDIVGYEALARFTGDGSASTSRRVVRRGHLRRARHGARGLRDRGRARTGRPHGPGRSSWPSTSRPPP